MAVTYANGPVWNAFGLGRSSYFVVPRRTLQSMPDEWQEKFVLLMEEATAKIPESAFPEYQVQFRENGKFATDPMANYRHSGPIPLLGVD